MQVLKAALLLLAAGAAAQAPEAAPEPARVDLLLRPAPDAAGGIERVEVTIALTGVRADPATPIARLPVAVTNVETATIGTVEARDARGPLRLTVRLDGSERDGTRFWLPDRPTEGMVTLRYSAPISGRAGARGPAPPLELRSEGGAFSGAGSTFLLLPPGPETAARLSVRWDLSALPAGAAAASSLGAGDAASAAPQPIGRLDRSFFMAGAIGQHADGDFFAAWQGTPPFDAPALMAWTGQLHRRFMAFFRPPEAMRYGVFLRHNPVNAGGGVGLADSFVATFGPATDAEGLKLTLTHEMFHTFAPSMNYPAGLESSWFGEGLAVLYARRLALRFGLITPDRFLENLNSAAARYYTSAMAELPNSAVPARFWADTRVRTLAYDRGSLYFAAVDDRMRKASRGRRSLDDLLRAMLARQRQGATLANADWEAVLRDALGPGAVTDFRAMLAGRIELPASDAFGPCFRRTTRPLRRYELGFEPAALTEQPRLVRGLIAGSTAEQAGLRNGDEIMRPVPQDGIQGNQTQLLRLEIRRDGQTFPLSYLPRGETVQAWQWERVPRVPDARCAL